MELKTIALTKEGKRQTVVCNGVRKQMVEKLLSVLTEQDFDACVAANGEIAIATAIDEETGATFYTRLAVSFSDKDLDSKPAPKKAPAKEPVVIPDLF